MHEKNDWDHNVEGDAVDGPVVCVSREEVIQSLNKMKTGKAPGPSEVWLELIAASRGVGIQVMAEKCQIVLNGFGMPVEWVLSIVVSTFKRKGNIRNCCCCYAMKRLEHGMKVVERVFEKRLCRIVSANEIQFGFMYDRGTIDAIFILRMMQEEYHANEKTCMCVLWTYIKLLTEYQGKWWNWKWGKKEYQKFWLVCMRVKDKSQCRFSVVRGVWGWSVDASRICAVTFSFCSGGRRCHWIG